MQWLVTYTTDYNRSQREERVNAADYTGAYLTVLYNNSKNIIILDIKKI